jgi:single-strand DNA-binding protein
MVPMNRVVLSGKLAGPPKLAYTPCGVPVATLRLRVPRPAKNPPREPALDELDCVAFRDTAIELTTWGERDTRVNVEGRLREEWYQDESGRRIHGVRVHLDCAYEVDPVTDPAATADAASLTPPPQSMLGSERRAA